MNSIFHRSDMYKWRRVVALLLSVVLMTLSVSDYSVSAFGGADAEYESVSDIDLENVSEGDAQQMLALDAAAVNADNLDGNLEADLEADLEVNAEDGLAENADDSLNGNSDEDLLESLGESAEKNSAVNTEESADADSTADAESADAVMESDELSDYGDTDVSGESVPVSDESEQASEAKVSQSYKYVTFPERRNGAVISAGVSFSVNEAEGVTPIEYVAPTTVYRIDTAAADEFTFNASVIAKYRIVIPDELAGIVEEKAERMADGEKWVYSYAVKLSELSEAASDAGKPFEIWLDKAADVVEVKVEGNAIVKGVDENGMAEIGETVSIELTKAGYVLAAMSVNEKGEQIYTAMPLDYNNCYEFTVSEEISFVVADPDTAEYAIINAAGNKSKLTGAAGIKLTGLASSAQGYKEIVLNFTAVKNGSDGTETENTYYEVKVTATPGAKETLPQGSSTEPRYYYIPKTADINTQSKSIQVNDGLLSADTACTYEFTVKMVNISKTITQSESFPKVDEAVKTPVTAALEGNAITKSFATKNLYYEDKLGFTKKKTTIYTGQQDLLVGAVKYSKNASYLHDLTAVAYDSDGAVCQELTCSFKNDNDELYISADEYMFPGKYKVVVYAGIGEDATANSPQGGTMYQASASFNLTVVSGINWIYTGGIATQVALNGKNTSFSAVPVGYHDIDWYLFKAKTQKFTYEIKSYDLETGVIEPNDNVKENVTVNAKGKVSINKKFADKAAASGNYIAVVITAADYEGNTNKETVVVEIVTTPPTQVPTEIYLADSNGNRLSGSSKSGYSITADKANGAYIVVLDQNGNNMNEYVNITPADNAKGTSPLYVSQRLDGTARLYARKLGTITIKAAMKNGWKKSKTLKVKVTEPSIYGNAYYRLINVTTDGFDASGITTQTGLATYDAPKGAVIKMQMGAVTTYNQTTPYYNHNWFSWEYEVTGGKLKVGDNCWLLTQTAKTMKLTVWLKSRPTRKYTVSFVNNKWGTKYENTPKLTLSQQKIYGRKYSNSSKGYGFGESYSSEVTNQQIICKYNEFVDAAEVKITRVKKGPTVWVSGFSATDRTFTLNVDAQNSYKAGSYKYKIAFYDSNGVMLYKPATITVKVNKTPAVKISPSYTMNMSEGSVKLKSTPAEFVPDYDTALMNANEGGKANDFNKYFELAYETDASGAKTGAVIRFKSSVTQQQKEELKGKKNHGICKIQLLLRI